MAIVARVVPSEDRLPGLGAVLAYANSGLGQPSPLVRAASDGDVAGVRSLLAGGADPNRADDSSVGGWTPLMAAGKSGSADVARALLKARANVNATNEYGATALDIAIVNHGPSSPVAVVIKAAGGSTRKEKGGAGPRPPPRPSDVAEARDYGGNVHNAAARGDLAELKVLLDGNTDLVSSKNQDGDTPLHLAALKGRKDVAELLLSSGASVDARDKRADTPLHVAAEHGSVLIVALLLAHGADFKAVNDVGLTPLGLAMFTGHTEVAEALRQHSIQDGADSGVATARRAATNEEPPPAKGSRSGPRFIAEEKRQWEIADAKGTADAYVAFHAKYPDTGRMLIFSGEISSGIGLQDGKFVGSVSVNGRWVASYLDLRELSRLGLLDQSQGASQDGGSQSISAKTLPKALLIMKNVGGSWRIAAVGPPAGGGPPR